MIPYPIIQRNELAFEFTTDQGVVYAAIFFDYEYLFSDYPQFSKYIYSFTLDVIGKEAAPQTPDDKVGETVITLFKKFFESKDNVVVYVCDSSDERHFARKRKFDWWFWKYNDGSILKVDGVAVISDFEIYNSILIHKENVFADKIIAAFNTLNERVDDK